MPRLILFDNGLLKLPRPKTLARIMLALLFLVAAENTQADTSSITPSDVYVQAVRIEQKTLELQRKLGIKEVPEIPKVIKTELLSRHIFARTYMLLTKISLFREQKKLPMVRPVSIEPQAELLPYTNWAQCLRILTEMEILEKALGVSTPPPPTPIKTEKKPVEVFNKLSQISAVWNVLIGGQITLPYIYAEAMRLNEDVSALLQAQGIIDTALPTARIANASAGDSLDASFDILREIQKQQVQAGLETINLEEFHLPKQQAQPQDVFNMIEILLAELQPLKVKLGLKHTITPVAQYYDSKKPADVAQVLGYIANRLHLLNLRQD